MPDPLVSVGLTLDQAERRLIEATVTECAGDKPRAAAMLGIALKTLYNKLNRYKREKADHERQ